jgi:N-acetyl-alpha-D-muramate 1-phosphate uridylyltransferase
MQAVILAGGLGTRLLPLTQSIPKAMVPVCGRPFLTYQLEYLAHHGIRDVILCVGHLGSRIESHFGDGRRFGVTIRYGHDGDRLLGTAGAIKNVDHLLDDTFFVTYGDSYTVVDFATVMEYFIGRDRLGLMVVLKNEDRWDRSNVVVDGEHVRVYDKQPTHSGLQYIDFGVSLFRRTALRDVPKGVPVDLDEINQRLIAEQQLLAYETRDRFYEIGSVNGLQELETLLRLGTIAHPGTVVESS